MNPTAPLRNIARDAPDLPPGVPAIASYRKFWAKRFGIAPFLPMSRAEMDTLGWDSCDVILVTGDAYIDHPSFGMALVGRLLEAQGFRVGIISQPDWKSAEAFKALGKPRTCSGASPPATWIPWSTATPPTEDPLGRRLHAACRSPANARTAPSWSTPSAAARPTSRCRW
jgi:hypothetical protein